MNASPGLTVTLAAPVPSVPAEAVPAVEPIPELLQRITSTKSAEAIPAAPKPVATPPGTQPPAPATAPAPPEAAPATTRPISPNVGLSGIVSGPWYYPARYLHRHTVPLKPIRPAYPRLSGETAGQVFLLMFVNERGTVDSYRVLKSEPQGMFDDIVIAAFARETYAPGLITGQAVKSQLLVEVSFEPGTDARVSILAEPPK